ncbi:MAG TPA: TonB-dependent receptor [Chitinophagaceae bacterium]|nr:TonB-dependent receptor [Chitinophagaceae bacterium]
MRKHFFVLAAIIISSLLSTASHGQAQDSTAKTMDEAIVTATKTPIKQSQTGKVITVISKEQIEKANGRSLGQLLNEQAGLTINGALNNAGTNQTVYLRGASIGRTLILVDGIPVYDPSLISSEFDLNLLSLNSVESIEICRGAQSTLYGSDAVGGVINIITVKKDISKPFDLKAMVSAGSFNTYRGHLQLYGKAGKFSYTGRLSTVSTKGFSSAYDSTGNGSFDTDKYNGHVASLTLQYQLAKTLSLRTFFQQSGYKTALDASVFTDEKDQSLESKNKMAGAGFQFLKNNVSISGNYQYSDITRSFLNDSIDRPGFTIYSTDDYYGKNQFLELFASIDMGSGFRLLQGADHRFANMNGQFLSISMFGPYTAITKDSVQSQSSVYASLFYTGIDERLNIELGGRLNVHSRYGSNPTFTFNPSYSINEHFRVFGSYATGYKAPSLYQLYSSYGNEDLEPERSSEFELGLQQVHAKFRNRIVYFNRDIKDGTDFDYMIYQYFNINRQKVNGLELETFVQPTKALTFSLNYTFLNPEESSQSRISFKDTTYNYLLRRPKHQFNLRASYQLKKDIFLSASAKYVGKRSDAGGYQAADAELESYFLLGAYAEYKFKKYVRLFADAQNILGKKFFDIRGYNSIPFTFNGGISFQL